jgi:TRAP transporter TAXI family solute receptor
MSTRIRLLLAFAASAALATACAAPRAAPGTASPTAAGATAAATATPNFTGRPLTIATGGTGGVYIIYGAGIANVLSSKLGVAGTAQSTTASVDNMKFIRDKKVDLALTLSDTAYDAVNAKGRFVPPEQPASAARSLAVMYNNFTHVVTKDGTGIAKVADLKGKRVSVGAPNSGTEVIANRVLEAVGLTQADLQVQKLGVADSVAQLKDGRIDAFFWSGGLPTSAITDLANTAGLKMKILDHADLVPKMAEKYGAFYFTATIPKDAYKLDADVKVSGTANLLVVHADMEEALAYAITKTIFDQQAELVKVHPEANNLKLESAIVGSPIDFHPGAIKFYKEKGVWKG